MLGMSLKRLLRRASASWPSPSANLRAHTGVRSGQQAVGSGQRAAEVAACARHAATGARAESGFAGPVGGERAARGCGHAQRRAMLAGCSLGQAGEEGAHRLGGGAQPLLIVLDQLQRGHTQVQRVYCDARPSTLLELRLAPTALPKPCTHCSTSSATASRRCPSWHGRPGAAAARLLRRAAKHGHGRGPAVADGR